MTLDSKHYSLPFLVALCIHITVLAFLIFELSLPVRSIASASSGNIVQAVAVSQQTLDNYEQAVNAAQQAQVAAQRAVQEQQQAVQRAAVLKAQQIQQQIKQQALKQQQLQLQKAQAMQAAKQQAEQAAAAKAAAAKAAAVKAAVAKAQQQVQTKKLQQALKQDMQNELNSDQDEINQNATAMQQNAGLIDKYKSLIKQAISQQWIVPQNLPNNISCVLDIRLAPGGTVIAVTVLQSSGNAALDNSAVAAVNKASPLPVPTDPGSFDQFRELHLTVKPDGTLISS